MSEVKAETYKVEGKTYSVGEILAKKFSIEYYQREYRWETRQITDLLNDLSDKFLAYYEPNHTRGQGAEYGNYFLGSIIINDEGPNHFIIDGQQRLTSLTLLLIYIYHNLEDNEEKAQIIPLIFSPKWGTKSFNLDVPERKACMEALLAGQDFDGEGESESVVNILARYEDIENNFPDGLAGKTLPHFVEWLREKVDMICISTRSSTDAYAIFETMNDRGVSLDPTEMLKGYLLSNSPEIKRTELNLSWKKFIHSLKEFGKREDADAIKAWLRSQYAQTIRGSKKGAPPGDFDKIGSEFHRWVRNAVEKDKKIKELQFTEKDHFANFISEDFSFYEEKYRFICKAAGEFDFAKKEKVEAIYYNARNNPALQHMVLLAPLRKEEATDKASILRKLRIVSSFLDILIARRLWNGKRVGYDTMRDRMFDLTRQIRRKSIPELITILTEYLGKMEETFESNEKLALQGNNKSHIRYLLARMTDYVETQSGSESRYLVYNRYEVEHIWAEKKYKEHGHENDKFKDEHEFHDYRNRIGGLLLLSKRQNSSYGELPYTEKRNYYLRENLLAQSLHEGTYDRNPGFVRFNNEFKRNSGLEFQPHPKFKKDDLDERQKLYRELCKQIWNPENLRDM